MDASCGIAIGRYLFDVSCPHPRALVSAQRSQLLQRQQSNGRLHLQACQWGCSSGRCNDIPAPDLVELGFIRAAYIREVESAAAPFDAIVMPTVPCQEPGGGPVGLMVCGVAMTDRRTLAVACALERALAG